MVVVPGTRLTYSRPLPLYSGNKQLAAVLRDQMCPEPVIGALDDTGFVSEVHLERQRSPG